MLTIRKAIREDAKAAWDIRNIAILSQCDGHYPIDDLRKWTEGEVSDEFADDVLNYFYVATYNDQVVGTGMINLEISKIDAMFVHPKYMKMGIGRKIIEYLERLARENGLLELNLESTLNAAPFYRACGFEGDDVRQYESPMGVILDCIPMVKKLLPNTSHNRIR